MDKILNSSRIASPTYPASDFVAHQAECRTMLKPCLEELLDMVESAGWNRRIAASTLMFLAAQQMSAAETSRDHKA